MIRTDGRAELQEEADSNLQPAQGTLTRSLPVCPAVSPRTPFESYLNVPIRQAESAESAGNPRIYQFHHPFHPLRTSARRSQQEQGECAGKLVHRLCFGWVFRGRLERFKALIRER